MAVASGVGVDGVLVKNLMGLEVQIGSYKNSNRGVKYSIGNIVDNNIITIYCIRSVLDLSGSSLHKLHKCLIMAFTPETNVTLYVMKTEVSNHVDNSLISQMMKLKLRAFK